MAKILKWTVPVDDLRHTIGGGTVVHVDSQHGRIDEIQIWTKEIIEGGERTVQVVGTGQSFPNDSIVLGSVVVSNGNLVWHAIELNGGA